MKVLFHAATPEALTRARANAVSLRQSNGEAAVVIIANGSAVAAALADPDPKTDSWLVLCAASMMEQGLATPTTIETTPDGIFLIAKMQRKGWAYLHA